MVKLLESAEFDFDTFMVESAKKVLNYSKNDRKFTRFFMVEISKKLLRIVGQTNARYKMFEDGDKIILG